MSLLTALAAIALMFVGTVFLIAAAVGVLRFPDALQRMHASTKAGTVGAVFMLLGAVVAQGETYPAVIGLVAIGFVLLTVPIAGHLLGRATYVSGAHLLNLEGRDALKGHLTRQTAPLERRNVFSVSGGSQDARPLSAANVALPEPGAELTDVRFALIAPDVDAVIKRALVIAMQAKVPLNAIAIIDDGFIEASRSPATTRPMVRERVAAAVTRLHELLPKDMDQFSLFYEEGDPVALIPHRERESSLLLLPPRGWCHHGVEVLTPLATGRPEGLLRLPGVHRGPVLYTGEKPLPESGARLALLDNGKPDIVSGVAWAVQTGLWDNPTICFIGEPALRRLRKVEAALKRTGKQFTLEILLEGSPGIPLLPKGAAQFDALITSELPRPKRTDWYGLFWHEQIAKGWHGEVLVVPGTAQKSS